MGISRNKLLIILIPFIVLIISSVLNFSIFFYSTPKAETIQFPSTLDIYNSTNPVVITTNGHLFYPKDYYSTNEKHPVVITIHGFEADGSTDLRMPLELTKRGFFVFSIDLPGAGHTLSVLRPYFWKIAIGAIDYVYSRPDLFDLNRVGMQGHSLGGWATFLAASYEAGHQNRLNCSVSWAGIANISRLMELAYAKHEVRYEVLNLKVDPTLFANPSILHDHTAVEWFNGSYEGDQPRNLLILHGTRDAVVNVEQAIIANNTTSNSSLYLVNDDHILMIDQSVLLKSIQWFYKYLNGQDVSFSSISAQGFTYLPFYILFLVQCLSIFGSSFAFVLIAFHQKEPSDDVDQASSSTDQKRKFLRFGVVGSVIVGGLLLMFLAGNLLFNLWIMLLIGSAVMGISMLILGMLQNRDKINVGELKDQLVIHFNDSAFVKTFTIALFGIFAYFFIAYSFKLFLYYPISVEYLFLSLLPSLGISAGLELFFRKGIQDHLPFKNRWLVSLIMSAIIILFFLVILMYMWLLFLAALALLLSILATSLVSTYIYQKTKNFLASALFQTVVVAFFIANGYYMFIF